MEDPENPGKIIENEALETVPYVVEALEKEGFRAVSVAAGDSVSVAVDDKGEVRAWGSFRVSLLCLGSNWSGLTGRVTKVSLVSTAYRATLHSNSLLSLLRLSPRPRSRSSRWPVERITFLRSPPLVMSTFGEADSRTSSVDGSWPDDS